MPGIDSLRSMRKSFWLWLTASILLLGFVILIFLHRGPLANILIPGDRDFLIGTIIENYPGDVPARNIQVTLDHKKIRVTKQGRFVADNLAIGRHVVSIVGKAYENTAENINIKKGKNKCTIKVSLTPVEAANRWMEIKKQDKYADTYFFLHPDDKKWIHKASYIQFKTNVKKLLGVKIKSYKVYPANTLKEWRSDRTKKIYKNIVSMRVSAVLEANQMLPTTQNWMVYAQKINGRWAFFSTE